MEIKEYQSRSVRTLNYNLSEEQTISNMIFGICGESGEVADILKKHLYQGHKLDKEHLKEELGDIMYYIVNLATMYDIDMREVLEMNVEKLLKRYPEGFETNKSINRREWKWKQNKCNSLKWLNFLNTR